MTTRPEILAPAGDDAALRAAVAAGADAVYFGLQSFNARARARNFDAAALGETIALLHRHGVRGYVTLNTLLFDAELGDAEAAVRACAAAGVDAVIVQDLGLCRLIQRVAPGLPVHASTQMTCSDGDSVALAAALGARRVILARELSVDEIGVIAAAAARVGIEVEVFVHGALCIAYSGQCLTSEAIGGRSANRGACAQACRLPYDLIVDGEQRDLGERAYLLSPQDLEASALVPRLIDAGVASLKIEGRLKGPEYVAAAVRLYRAARAAALGEAPDADAALSAGRDAAVQMYSRGSGPGFLQGVDHQRLVEGRGCDHRGLLVGDVLGVVEERRRAALRVRLSRSLARGDGVLVEGGREGAGEVGGRVWTLRGPAGEDLVSAEPGAVVLLWLGPERDDAVRGVRGERRLFRNSAPAVDRAVLAEEPARRPLSIHVRGVLGQPPVFVAHAGDGAAVEIRGDAPLAAARGDADLAAVLRDKLGRLGDTPFTLAALTLDLPPGSALPPSSLNRVRRALVAALLSEAPPAHATTDSNAAALLAAAAPPDRSPPPPGLFALCRNAAQAEAALAAGADGVYLDFLELTGTGAALRALRAAHPQALIGVAPPRVRKPGEDKIDRYLLGLAPDLWLVRSLGSLRALAAAPPATLRIGDFSLNVANRLSAAAVLTEGLSAFTPCHDLDAAQLLGLLDTPFGPFAELIVHHPMPLFHMEHCVFAALLSSGRDHRDCGRPCERHQVSLRDRAGMTHALEADVGCRNTVFHAASQSAAELVPRALGLGVRRLRVELLRESPAETAALLSAYAALRRGEVPAAALWRRLRAPLPAQSPTRSPVVRGTLRVLA